tara:strand:+ start:501 stop:983 length:483 start_codon:yes stop_codon:yes gene_type:complete
MGLDMYLTEQLYYGGQWRDSDWHEEGHTLIVKGGFAEKHDLKKEQISTITRNLADWRKANSIHGWFIRNCANGVDDCKEVEVTQEDIQALYDNCLEVKKAFEKKDFETCLALLPPVEGFFFGDTEVDNEWYYQDIKYTIDILKPLIENPPKGFMYYRASW